MRSRLQLALMRLFLAVMLAATPGVILAQEDPHHPDDGTTAASPGEEQPAPVTATEDETAGPTGTSAPGQVAVCPGAIPMMGMMLGSPENDRSMGMPVMQTMQSMAGVQMMQGMQMIQGMAGMQMQVMQGMQMMQQTQLEIMRTMQSMQQQMMTMQQMLGDQRPRQEMMP